MNDQLFELLKKYQQLHLLETLENNTSLKKEILSCFLELDNFYPLSFEKKSESFQNLVPFETPSIFQKKNREAVIQHLRNKQAACVILAGGDGSRLGTSLPKGCFPLCYENKKSLFEILCSKLLSLQNKIDSNIPLIILTSKSNNKSILEFFEKNKFFGLNRSSIEFLIQPHLPLFCNDKTFFKTNGSFASGPNGNGVIFRLLASLLLLQSGIETFQIINIDNPLVYPIDLELVETHLLNKNDVSLRCIPLSQSNENIGRLYTNNGRLSIVDYTDDRSNNSAKFGNINIFVFSKKFIHSICAKNLLPLHWVKKEIRQQELVSGHQTPLSCLKGEIFITDAVKFADKVSCILTEPKDYFAPLKSLEGPGNLKEAQEALLRKENFLSKGSNSFDPNLYYSKIDLQSIV